MTNGVILAVDDASDSLKLLTQILGRAGYQVRPADSGELAITSATANPPDLILLDIRMPGMDGFTVCRKLKTRSETRNIPVIFLSGIANIEERVEGLRLGAVDFVSKPFRTDELLARVETHLAMAQTRKSLEQTVKARTVEAMMMSETIKLRLEQAAEETDWQEVSRLLEPTALIVLPQDALLRAWLLRLPEACEAEPGLAFWRAVSLAGSGKLDEAEAITVTSEFTGKDSSLHVARLLALRSKIAEMRGDGPTAVELAIRGLELSSGADTLQMGVQHHWLGVAYSMAGRPIDAEARFLKAVSYAERLEGARRWLISVAYSWYGRTLMHRGRLNDAIAVCRQALSMEREFEGPAIQQTSTLEADVMLQRNLLDLAQDAVERSIDVDGSLNQWYGIPHAWLTAARVHYARDAAQVGNRVVDNLVEWARRYNSAGIRNLAEAIRASYWLRIGETERAWLWATERKLTDDAEFSYVEESTFLALGRTYVQHGCRSGLKEYVERAIPLFHRLQECARRDSRHGDYLAALVAEAVAHHALDKATPALDVLEQCLTIAIPESAFRVFVDEGSLMKSLLQIACERSILPETTQGLIAMLSPNDGLAIPSADMVSHLVSGDLLVNPLTDREFELLELIASGMTNADLASRLYISNNTVKTHVKHLFHKLEASSRTEAVARARSLGYLKSGRPGCYLPGLPHHRTCVLRIRRFTQMQAQGSVHRGFRSLRPSTVGW